MRKGWWRIWHRTHVSRVGSEERDGAWVYFTCLRCGYTEAVMARGLDGGSRYGTFRRRWRTETARERWSA